VIFLISVNFQTWIGIKPKHVFLSSGQGSKMSPQTGRLLLNKSDHCVILSCSLILSIAIVKEIIAMLVKVFPYLIGICLNYIILWFTVCALHVH
jgi:xanthine/uracil permease